MRIEACVLLMLTISMVNSARILGIVNMPSYSHFLLGDRIFRELATRGHEVTVITAFELKDPVPNLRHVVLTGILEEAEAMKKDFFTRDINPVVSALWLETLCVTITDRTLSHPNVKQLLESDVKFDLVIYEDFLNEAFSGFAYQYKVPYVTLSTTGASRWTSPKLGNPHNPAYMPENSLGYPTHMNFRQRLINSFVYAGAQLFSHLYRYPKQNELLQKYFPGTPHLQELMYNNSLLLVNSHPSIAAPVPLVPNMIEIGGYHVQPSKTLPKDLQGYLDSAKNGAIFFSMGSNMKSKDMSEEIRNAIVKSLGKLKLKVLWKWEDDVLPEQPHNVKLGKWLPQQDILAHPKVKLFITHGGLLSTIEAIHHGVPVLGIPVFGDQRSNMQAAENAGYGISVPYKELTESNFSSALDEILNNNRYAENAKHRSRILHDQQTKPLDRAIYWIEYVMRHPGAPYLKTAAIKLAWYQYLLLDVVVVAFVGTVVVAWTLCKIIKLLCGKNKKSVTSQKKRN